MTGQWLQYRNLCCGDDLGEGGFPYDTTTPNDQLKSVNGFSSDKMGEYSSPETVCDDMAKDSQGNWEEIDNDCNGKANCADNWCAPNDPGPFSNRGSYFHKFRLDLATRKNHLGPKGSLCCSTGNACKNFLDPLGKPTGVDCNQSKECDCKAVGTFVAFNNDNLENHPWVEIDAPALAGNSYKKTIHTCAASGTEVATLLGIYGTETDRHIIVKGQLGGYDVKLTASDIGGGDTVCGNNIIQLNVYKSFPEWTGVTATPSVTRTVSITSNSPTLSSGDSYFVIAIENTNPDVDCLVDIEISMQ